MSANPIPARPGAGKPRTSVAVLLGAGVSVAVATLAVFGVMSPLERVTLDWRFRLFHASNPHPSDRVIHIDIDDASIDRVGRWPWPRARLADVVDELNAAGASVIAFDVLFNSRQEPRIVERDGGGRAEAEGDDDGATAAAFERIEDDAVLADAIRRAGNVVLAVNLTERAPTDELDRRVRELLAQDVTLDADEVADRLTLNDLERARLADGFGAHKSAVIADALRRLADGSGGAPPSLAECRAAVLPDLPEYVTRSPELALLREERDRLTALAALKRALPPVDERHAGLHDGGEPVVPIPPLAEAAAGAGAVFFRHDPDGIVRCIPLWLTDGRRAYPHLSLAVACLDRGVPIADVVVDPDVTVIPGGPVGDLAIPMIPRRAGDGWVAPHANVLITWPTANDWPALFDPAGKSTRQHLPIGKLIELADARRSVEHNQRQADIVLLDLITRPELNYSASDAQAYHQTVEALRDAADEARRAELIAQRDKHRKRVLDNATFLGESILADPEAEPADRKLGESIMAAVALHRDAVERSDAAAAQIAQQTRNLADRIGGRVCIIGWTSTGAIADFVPTSLEAKVPGPVIHGAMLNAILTGHFLQRDPAWIDALLVILVGLAATAIAAALGPVTALAATAGVIAVYFVINGVLLFDVLDRWSVFAAPALAAAAAWAVVTVYRLVSEQRQRLAITRQFKNYIDPSLVELLVADPTRIVTGERELTCMFSDIAGFTTISEQLGTDRTADLLNRYLARATDALMAHRGTVNKYLGDGIMAFWGAPVGNERHAMDTCVGVLAVRDGVAQLNGDPALDGCPELVVRTGIATGPMMVGDFGAPPRRSDYTVIGDTVNFSARLESANKQFGTRIMVSQRTKDLIDEVMLTRPIGRLVVVGKSKPESVFELLNTRDAASDAERQLAADTTEAVEVYYAADFTRCRELFEKLAQTHGVTKLTERYIDACRAHVEAGTPAEGFDGTLVLTQK